MNLSKESVKQYIKMATDRHTVSAMLLSCLLLTSMVLAVVLIRTHPTHASQEIVETQPEQVHLSYGMDETQMVVTWVTMNPTPSSQCEFGQDDELTEVALGYSGPFEDGGYEKRVIYVHRVTLTGLKPGAGYMYHCGSELGWSPMFWFRAMRPGTDWSPRLVVYGDMGNENGRSIPHIQQDVARGMYDAVLHVGDFAYDMRDDNGRVGDAFMRQVEPIAAYVPYQTCVGNHEEAYNFSQYVNRFSMINMEDGELNNMFYSFDIGPAHVISLSTEYYFYVQYGWWQIANQFRWLEQDLQRAQANRAQRPWIITMGHRPMYCSTDDTDDCTFRESITRTGLPLIHSYGLEKLFHKYGVDLMIWAHEHVYERLYPVYDRRVYNGSATDPYDNPKAPVHVITGSAGCKEYHDGFVAQPSDWSAFRSADYGYSRMTIHNGTHLEWEQISVDQNAVIDRIMIRKDHHGPYLDLDLYS